MWYLSLINIIFHLHPVLVKSAWVEIPQLPGNKKTDFPQIRHKPAQFVFGTPKVSFLDHKPTTTTPSNHKMIATTPRQLSTTLQPSTTTLLNYKNIMTTSIPPLTSTPSQFERQIDEEMENNFAATKKAKIERMKIKPQNNKTESNDNNKKNIYSGFMPLLQNIQETLTLNAKKSLNSKISLLTSLRDNLLLNIDERMSNIWKKLDPGSEARGYEEKEMDFPSNEGALMTIGFLTFAVFLIKLVLKLIHALKSKSLTDNGTITVTVPTGTATAVIGRKKRGLDEDTLKILQYIDEYKFS